jgi:hypothetical protein
MNSFAVTWPRRTSALRLALLTSTIALLVACGGDSTSPSSGDTGKWNVVSERSWTLPPASEGYSCRTTLATTDEYFSGLRLASPSAAQEEVYLVIRNSATLGDYDCNEASIVGGEMIYAASYGTGSLEFTNGKGVHIAAGQSLTLVIHMNNTAAAPVTATTTVEGRASTANRVTTPVDMFFAGAGNFTLPGGTHGLSPYCISPGEHLVALLPMMRHLGIHQKVDVTIDSTVSIILDKDFDPTRVVYSPLTSDLNWPVGSRMVTTCTFNNYTAGNVVSGPYAYNESCTVAVYRYPTAGASPGAPYECGQF